MAEFLNSNLIHDKTYILTIAIPTYNRPEFLFNLLSNISQQLDELQLKSDIQIFISDNSDITDENIIYFTDKLCLKYIKNQVNIGVIKNVVQSIMSSDGQYVLLIGDDDFFIEGGIARALETIKLLSNDIGAVWFESELDNQYIGNVLNCTETVRNFFWKIGNVGNMIIRKDIVQAAYDISECTSLWPQTEIYCKAMYLSKTKLLIAAGNIAINPNHHNNTRYCSPYLWKAGYFSLIECSSSLLSYSYELFQCAIKNINSRYSIIPLKKWLKTVLFIHFKDTYEDKIKIRGMTIDGFHKYKKYISKRMYLFYFFSYIPSWMDKMFLSIFNKKESDFKENRKNSDDYI